MKLLAKISLVGLVARVIYGDVVIDPSPSRGAGASLDQKVNEDFKYAPRANSNQPTESSPPTKEEKVIPLERYVVTPFSQYKLLELSFKQQEEALKEKTFTNNTGGTLYETQWGKANVELKFKYNPSHNLMDIIKVSW